MIIPKEKAYEHTSLAREHVDKKTRETHVLKVEVFDQIPKFELDGQYYCFWFGSSG